MFLCRACQTTAGVPVLHGGPRECRVPLATGRPQCHSPLAIAYEPTGSRIAGFLGPKFRSAFDPQPLRLQSAIPSVCVPSSVHPRTLPTASSPPCATVPPQPPVASFPRPGRPISGPVAAAPVAHPSRSKSTHSLPARGLEPDGTLRTFNGFFGPRGVRGASGAGLCRTWPRRLDRLVPADFPTASETRFPRL